MKLRLLLLGSLLFAAGCKDPFLGAEFTFDPPSGWEKKDVGLKHPAFMGPTQNNFRANINVVQEEFSGSLDNYIDHSLKNLRKIFSGFRQLTMEPFTTTSGVEGFRIASESKIGNISVRQIFYVFGKGNNKYVVTCSQAPGGDNDDLFDKTLKTWRFK